MEKLIELLNKFYEENGGIFKAIGHRDRQRVFALENDDMVRDTAIISKQYGFIKWLVDNKKVKEFGQVIKDIDIRGSDTIAGVDTYSDYESLLMLLAIQNNPIEFLISILK